jgi:hypothetical protein
MSWSTTGRVVDMAVQTKRASGGPAAVVPVDPPLRKPMKTVGMSLQMMKSDVADPPASPHRMVSQTAEPPSVFDTTPAKRSERLSRTSDAQNTATAGLASAPMPSTTKLDEETIAVLIKRAERFIDAGDFSSARADLRRPAEAGNRKAALALARTYDPAEFKRFGVRGLAPDPVQARHWYERARSFGSTEEPKPAGAPTLREGELWLIVASSSEFETAVTMARKYKPEFPTAMVLNSENGQYAVILGRFLEDSGRQQLAKLKAENKVRQDSYLSVGNKLRDVAWR